MKISSDPHEYHIHTLTGLCVAVSSAAAFPMANTTRILANFNEKPMKAPCFFLVGHEGRVLVFLTHVGRFHEP